VLLTCGLAGALGYDEYRLAHVRHEQAVAQSFAQRQADEEKIVQAKSKELAERNEAYKAESAALRKQLADMKAGKPAAVVPDTAGAPGTAKDGAAETAGDGKAKPGFGKALAQMMQDPSMKKMVQQQQAMVLRTMYGELPKQLGLDQQHSDQLMELLSQRQTELMDKSFAAMNGSPDKAALAKATSDITAQYDDQLKALLGDSYPQFQAYEKTIPDRTELNQLQTQLSGLGMPLTDDQRAGLLAIMTEERSKSPPSPFTQNGQNVAAQMDMLSNDGAMHDFFARQEDLYQRVLARAGGVLSPEQVTSFANLQKQMLQMQQAGLNMSRQMFNTQK
jgi:hypothetical protein